MEGNTDSTRVAAPRHDSVALGFFGAVLVDLVIGYLIGQSNNLAMFLFFGAVQWLWLVPAFTIAAGNGYRRVRTGILIAGSIVFLLNAAGWGICFASLSKI